MLQKLQNLAAFSSACQALRAGKSPLLLDGLAAVHKAHFAAALCRVLATGVALDADDVESRDADLAGRLTHSASGLVRMAEELEQAAVLWRADRLD